MALVFRYLYGSQYKSCRAGDAAGPDAGSARRDPPHRADAARVVAQGRAPGRLERRAVVRPAQTRRASRQFGERTRRPYLHASEQRVGRRHPPRRARAGAARGVRTGWPAARADPLAARPPHGVPHARSGAVPVDRVDRTAFAAASASTRLDTPRSRRHTDERHRRTSHVLRGTPQPPARTPVTRATPHTIDAAHTVDAVDALGDFTATRRLIAVSALAAGL